MSEVQRAQTALRVAGHTGTGYHGLVGARTGKALFSHRYGPMFTHALTAETRTDLPYRPYRSNETNLVPPDSADPFEPGCDRCGQHPARYAMDLDATLHLLCTTHMARWDHQNRLARYRRAQEQTLIDWYRRWRL